MTIDFDWARDYRGNLEWLQANTILLVAGGSHSYGLNTPESDLDVKGICIPPKKYLTGFLHKFEQAESKNPDLTVFDIRKFFSLACEANPNILEVLWTDEADIIQINEFGHRLRHFKTLFVSQRAKYSFSGYAVAQLKRLRTHRKWILNPPTHKPTRGEFELPETTILSADIMGAVESLAKNELHNVAWFDNEVRKFSPEIMHAYQRERAYHNALVRWQQYENWKKTRNPERAKLEAEHGYDAKHAMHLVRLMRMCEEILTTGQVVVKRPDREELLAIRNGAWTYDQLIEWAEKQDAKMDELLLTTKIPKSPDRTYLDGICRTMVEEFIGCAA